MGSLLALSFIAGAVHVVAPDHWMPLSLVGWQKRWTGIRLGLVAASAYAVHAGLGFLIFIAARPLMAQLRGRDFLWAAIGFVVLCGGLRSLRFQRHCRHVAGKEKTVGERSSRRS